MEKKREKENCYVSRSPEDTFSLGRAFGEKAGPGEIYCLDGDLGAGKTVFAQGFARGLNVAEAVNSPTFTIVNVYESGRIPLYHFDLYRIEEPEEMEEIGYEDYFFGEGVCLVEWSELVPEIIPEHARHIRLNRSRKEGETNIRLIRVDLPESGMNKEDADIRN